MTTGGYDQRVVNYPAEIADVAAPRLLAGLLRGGMTVAEIPSGTGHFLRAYAVAGARVVLVDASAAMLAAARPVGTRQILHTMCARVEDLPGGELRGVDVVVMPNATLNQLAAAPGSDLAEMLAAAASVLRPGGLLLAQILLAEEGKVGAGCGFYDPQLPDGVWHPDRTLRDTGGRPVVRRRRQHHRGDQVLIDFSFTCGDVHLYDHQVTITLFAAEELRDALAVAGLHVAQRLPADTAAHRPAEVLARLKATSPQSTREPV